MLVQDFLEQNAKARPDKTALVCGEKRFTYAELDQRANRLAHALQQRGVKRGDRVGIYLANSAEAVIGIFATLKADAAFVAQNRVTRPEKVISVLKNCEASAVLMDTRATAHGLGDRLLAEVPS